MLGISLCWILEFLGQHYLITYLFAWNKPITSIYIFKSFTAFIMSASAIQIKCKQSLIPLSILSCHLLSLPHNKSITYETKELNFRCL